MTADCSALGLLGAALTGEGAGTPVFGSELRAESHSQLSLRQLGESLQYDWDHSIAWSESVMLVLVAFSLLSTDLSHRRAKVQSCVPSLLSNRFSVLFIV